MSAVSTNTSSYLQLDTLSGVDDADTMLQAMWFKHSGSASPGSEQYIFGVSNAWARPQASLMFDSGQNMLAAANYPAGWPDTTGDVTDDAWEHWAFETGALSANPYAMKVWKNGSLIYDNTRSDAFSGSMARLMIFGGGFASAAAVGKAAEYGLWLNPANAAAIVAELQTQAITALTVPPFLGFRLLTENTAPNPDEWPADVGSGTLLESGTVTLDGADHPSVSTTPPASSRRRAVVFV